ncbi:hypothetical protein ACFE04_005970 [Oxalis oulophora]
MENSMGSMSKVSYDNKESSKEEEEEEEESGWTMYLQDFSIQNYDDVDYSNNINIVEEEEDYDDNSFATSSKGKKFSEMLLKRKKTYNNKNDKRIFLDDDLEDTATSPVSSPKVSGNTFSDHRRRIGDEMGFIGGERECTELKKKGLCLVPLSLVSKYLG